MIFISLSSSVGYGIIKKYRQTYSGMMDFSKLSKEMNRLLCDGNQQEADSTYLFLFSELGFEVAEYVFSGFDSCLIAKQSIDLCADGCGQFLLEEINHNFDARLSGGSRDTGLLNNQVNKFIHKRSCFEHRSVCIVIIAQIL
jgi:hypothetical protein